MKRRKTKITNKFEELFDESTTITIHKHSKETEEFLQKYSYITFDDRLTSMARALMFSILSFPKDTVLTSDLLKNVMAESRFEIQTALEELTRVDYIRQIDSLTEEPAYICNVDR